LKKNSQADEMSATGKDRNNRRSRRRRERRGSALVEHAFALPILFGLFLGMWEFARAEMIRQAMTTAAYEAARQGIPPGSTAQEVRRTATSILQAARIQGTVDVNSLTPTTQEVQVTIRAKMNDNSWVAPVFYRNRQIVATFNLRREGYD
jgi:hypothetical protein